jgi:hypothetical protein
MTHGKRHPLPSGERALTPIIAGHFPGGHPFQPLPNNCQADFITYTSIAEVEPILRWQTGLSQALEYWTLTLQSLHPILILVDQPGAAARRALRRAETTIAPLPIQLMVFDPERNKFTRGGPDHHSQNLPDGPPLTARGETWHAPEYLIRAYDHVGLPYCCWRETYLRRIRQAEHTA